MKAALYPICLAIILNLNGLLYEAFGLDWHAVTGGRCVGLEIPKTGKSGFSLVSPALSGLAFTNYVSEDRHLTNQILLNGSGLAAGDMDGDGLCDLFFSGLSGGSKLFRNLGNWKFQDVTATAGITATNLDCTGAAFADIDGDGDLDLIVNSIGGGTHVYLNNGKGHFTQMPGNLGLNAGRGGMSLALADVDGDGDLDLYVANYRVVTIRDQPNTRFTFSMVEGKPVVTKIDGKPVTDPDLANRFNYTISMDRDGGTFIHEENGEADALFLNDGAGRFTPVSFTNGAFLDEKGLPLVKPPFDWGLSVMFRDLNGDGAPDIYVCNDFKSVDRIWINDGKGHFRAIAPLAVRQTSLSSMGVDFADINRDGHEDFFVVDMLSRDPIRRFTQRFEFKSEASLIGQIDDRPQSSRNTLLLNRGDNTYAEIAQLSGLEASEWSWAPVFLDVDLDGYEDLLISNGFQRDNMNADVLMRLEAMKREQKLPPLEQLRLRKIFPKLETANFAFRNLGNLKFSDVSAEWGFNAKAISQGMALVDLDNDGDLDVVINNMNGAASVYRNDTIAPRVAVRLKGLSPNTQGIGAKIKVLGGPVPQSQEIICGGRYLSADDPMRVFAAGASEMSIEVNWRSGKRSLLQGVEANFLYEVDESKAELSPAAPPATVRNPLFQDVSQLISHSHHEDPFDDFALQPLLPHRLSQLGPGLAWFDVDGDGWEDLIIGSGRGGQLAAFRNGGKGGFTRIEGAPFSQPVTRDQTTVLGWRNANGQAVLLAGSANYEDGLTNGSVARQYDLAGKVVLDSLPGQESSTGPLAMTDLDGLGHSVLFVGGRVIPGRFPEAASSLMFRESAGKWALDEDNTKRLAKVGLVSGAVFSDIDGDGDPDLILACSWGPVRIFQNDQGKFIEASEAFGLSQYLGWWNGIATGDFDGDGRLDIVASNWGQNTKYESFRQEALRLYYGDFDEDGTVDILEAYFDPQAKRTLPLVPFHVFGAAVPTVRERLGSYEKYAKSTVQEILGLQMTSAKEVRANWLETTVLLNRGNHFEAKILPVEAQMTPAFGICVGDLDGDGLEDIFLSQNFFATSSETSRSDAGRGLWLRGDGKAGFQAVPGQESGLRIYGEQRGAALCDYDADGRVDLAVSQNGAETKLYRNVGAHPGLRIRLLGPPGNPNGVGAMLRVGSGDQWGPAREIHAGSGYWSQDSSVQVMAAPASLSKIFIRWPGGKEQTLDVPAGAKEVAIEFAGKLKLVR